MPPVFSDPQVALQGGDRVLLAVTNFTRRSYTILLNRFRADGSLDTTFAGSSVIAQDPRGMQSIDAIAVMPDDRIVLGGASANGVGQILFLTPSGKIDRSRGKNGALVLPGTNPFAGIKEAFTIRAMAAAPDGSLYVAGFFDSGNGFDFTVAKLAP